MSYKISVIVPCYNVEKYIDRCVRSLVRQTIGIANLELIFVNDASTDTTLERLKRWERRFPDNIAIIDCADNSRQGGARNIGLRHASADYIGFVDSDDWVEPEMYEEMYAKITQYQCDIVGVHFQREESSGHVYEIEMPKGEADILVEKKDEKWPEGVQGFFGGVWSRIYRKSLILDNEIFFPENLAYEDNYWGALLNYYYNSYYIIPKPMYHYIVNRNSTLMQQNSQAHLDRLTIEILKLEELKRRGFIEGDEEGVEASFVKLYYINSLNLFFTRYTRQPYAILNQMQEEVRQRFPNYQKNPSLQNLGSIQNALLQTLQMNFKEEEWESMAERYRKGIGVKLEGE